MAKTTDNTAASAAEIQVQESRRLYRNFLHARAAWNVRLYDPDKCEGDLPDEIARPLMEADEKALRAFLEAPAGSLYNIARKLETMRSEALCSDAAECLVALHRDVEQLMEANRG